MAAPGGYYCKSLTGGGAGALDSIDGSGLSDQDMAFVFDGTNFYMFQLDADSAAAESSPDIISPDTNAGDKRWILQDIYVNVAREWSKSQNFDEYTLSISASAVDLDFEVAQCAVLTLTENVTMNAPTNGKAGLGGMIRVIQDPTGSRTITWNSNFKPDGGVAITLASGANEETLIGYYCRSATNIKIWKVWSD